MRNEYKEEATMVNCRLMSNIDALGVIHAVGIVLELEKIGGNYSLLFQNYRFPLKSSDVEEI